MSSDNQHLIRDLRTRAAHLRRVAMQARKQDQKQHAAALDTRANELERQARDQENRIERL